MLMFYDIFFFCKQKTAYEMRISDWSSDVCSSDLVQTNSPVKEIALHADFIGVHRFNVIGSDVDEEGSSPIESAASKATRIRGVKQHVEIGRASCRERVCQYVSILVVAVTLKKKRIYKMNY